MKASSKARHKRKRGSKEQHGSPVNRGGDDSFDVSYTSGNDGKTEEKGVVPVITGHHVQVDKNASKLLNEQNSASKLDPLLMKTGSLDDLLGPQATSDWTRLSERLRDTFSTASDEDAFTELCTIYYYPNKDDREIRTTESHTELANETANFLETFMDENGQWDYIQKQEWFTTGGDYLIGIDVNYYANRFADQEALPGFHKDTGGNNIFVNLVFDNKDPIQQTEWFADLAAPSKVRRDWQATLLPQSFRNALDESRESLKAKYPNDENVRGGISQGPNSYVSWVDDLVWHATPTSKPRLKFDEAIARESYDHLNDAAVEDADFSFFSTHHDRTMLGAEILATMAESGDTELSKWLKGKGLGPADIDVPTAQQAWKTLYTGPEGKDTFISDARQRVAYNQNWRVTGLPAEANAHDNRLSLQSKQMFETPGTLSTRRRANSLSQDDNIPSNDEVKNVQQDNKAKPRSFLRTWVRILRMSDADEPQVDPDTTDETQVSTEEVTDQMTHEIIDETNNRTDLEQNTDTDQ